MEGTRLPVAISGGCAIDALSLYTVYRKPFDLIFQRPKTTEGWAEADVDALNQRVAEAMFADGYAALTTTVLRGRTVLRMCTITPRTTEEDIRGTIDRLDPFAGALIRGT